MITTKTISKILKKIFKMFFLCRKIDIKVIKLEKKRKKNKV